MIIFNAIWHIINYLFVKREKAQNNFINIDCLRLTSGCSPAIMWRKPNYITVSKDLFDLSLHSIN